MSELSMSQSHQVPRVDSSGQTPEFGIDHMSMEGTPSSLSHNFIPRLGDTVNTLFREELPEKGHRVQRAGALVLAGATQIMDRGRAMVFVLPWAFERTTTYAAEHDFNNYQSAGAAAIAVGGIFGAWGYAVGKSFHKSLNAFPATTEKVVNNHPVMVGVISKAIDGFPSQEKLSSDQPIKPEEGYDVGPYDSRKTILGKVALSLTRGLKTVFLYGTTAHVGVAKISGHSDESNEKRRRVVTAEAAVTIGAIAAGLNTMVTHNFLDRAQQVQDVLTNKTYLTSASLGFIGIAAITNYFSRKSYGKKEQVTFEVQTNEIIGRKEEAEEEIH